MPTIELVSLNAVKLNISQSDFDIALIEENNLIGHRGLFNKYLSDKKGVMVHIGNPEFKNNISGGFYAGEIIDWDFEPNDIYIPNADFGETGHNQDFKFKFKIDYQIDLANLILKAIEKSPDFTIYFMTDYQFGPENPLFEEMNIDDFWIGYEKFGLDWNTLYKLKDE